MTVEGLKELADRLLVGPAPTTEKKLYAFSGPVQILRNAIPGLLLIDSNILDAFNLDEVNIPEDKLRELIPRRLSAHLSRLQEPRRASVILLREAMILYRYRIALTFLYELVGDTRAIVLHYSDNQHQQLRAFPSYIRFDPGEAARFLRLDLAFFASFAASREACIQGPFSREGAKTRSILAMCKRSAYFRTSPMFEHLRFPSSVRFQLVSAIVFDWLYVSI